MTSSDEIYKLFSQFSPRMEFSDSQTGFYGGLRETFQRLAMEEKVACQWENIQVIDYPTFGFGADTFEDVVRQFYLVWSGFSTNKSFTWKDTHRYSEAPDRRVRRFMEKENRRLREESIREFNDAVRSLVAFAKKRDPRYKANAQSEDQRQEALRQASAAQAARSRAANEAKLRDISTPEWAKAEDREEEDTSVSEGELERFECIVCRKSFKSPMQLAAHERSKKHKKAIKQLCWEMEAQNKRFGLDTGEDHEDIISDTNGQHSVQSDSDSLQGTSGANFRANTSNSGCENFGDPSEALVICQTQIPTTNNQDVCSVSDGDPSYSDCHGKPVLGSGDNDADYASRDSVMCRLGSGNLSDEYETFSLVDASRYPSNSDFDGLSSAAPQRLGKAKQKRNKKAARMTAQQPLELICATCNACFPSKTQLFRHIRELNHVQTLDKIKNK